MGIFTQNHKGIYFKTSSSSIQYTNGGSDVMTFLSSGNVGIGTTDPGEKLTVDGNISATGTITGSNLSGTNTGDQDLSVYYTKTESDGRFVNVAGDTMTGDLILESNKIDFKTNGSSVLPNFLGHRSGIDLDTRFTTQEGGWSYTTFDSNSPNIPTSGLHNANGLLSFNTHGGDYGHQIAMTTNTQKIYFRSRNNTAWGNWYEFYHEGHKPTYSELGTMAYSNLTGTPTIPTDFVSAANGGTFSGDITAPSFIGKLMGGATGAPDATIWCVSGEYTDWGIFYDENTPDVIQFKSAGTSKATIALDNGDINSSGNITASNFSGTSSGTNTGDQDLSGYALTSHNHDERYFRRFYGTATGVSNAGFTTAFTVNGGDLASSIRMSVQGTTGSVVVSNLVDIVVNHYQDIMIKSLSGVYTKLTLKVVSNNNEDFAIELKTNSVNPVDLSIEVLCYGAETVTFTNSHSYTGSTLEKELPPGEYISGTGGNNGNSIIDGNVGIGTNNPSEKLNVSGNILATGTILGSNLSGTNTGDQDLSGYALTGHSHSNYMLRSSNPQTNVDAQLESSAYRFDPSTDLPTNAHHAVITYGNQGNVVGQIASHFQTGESYVRGHNSGWSGWRKIYDSVNLTNVSQLTNDAGYLTSLPSHNHDSRYLRKDTSDAMAGVLTLNSGGTNTYGRIRGYENDNHFITIRGGVETGTSTLNITPGHQTTFVEHADSSSEGWYFVSKASGNYTELGRLDGLGNMFTTGSHRSPIFYDSNDTTYYIDPNSTARSARLRGGMLIGTNNTWSKSLQVGGNGREFVDNAEVASVVTTNGNLHLDAASGFATYLNFYDGTKTNFGNGSNGIAGEILADGSARFPIFYDYNNTSYYLNPASTSVLDELNVKREQRWFRDSSNNAHQRADARLDGSDQARLHWYGKNDADSNANFKHAWYDGSNYINVTAASSVVSFENTSPGYTTVTADGDFRAPIFYDSDNTAYYLNPASESVLNNLTINGTTGTGDGVEYFDINVGGDADTYYPVGISGGAGYGMHQYSISRRYNWTAPNTWYSSTHKGGLTLTLLWSGDSAWGGNYKDIRVVDFYETYSTMLGGIDLAVSGNPLIIWLRGGGAHYRIHHPRGKQGAATVHLTSWTAANGTVYSPRSSAIGSSSELIDRWPVRNKAGSINVTSRVDAPIFYDRNNTAYYGDFSGNSRYNTAYGNYLGLGTAANTSGSYRLNMGGNIRMNNNGIDYTSQLHFNSNVRFYQDSNDSYLNFKYGDAATGGIKFLNGGGSLKGYVYADNSGFGLLDNDGAWAIRTRTGTDPLEFRCDNNLEFSVYTSYTLSHGSSRAPIFYDSDNTGYYLNPASTSILNVINTGNLHADNIYIENGSTITNRIDNDTARLYITYGGTSNRALNIRNDNGSVGIGVNDASEKLEVSGNVKASNFILSSDETLKENVKDLDVNVDAKWKSYKFKNEDETRYGVIAQELEETNPELVKTDEQGLKSVKYIDLLIAKIAELEARLEKAGL